MSKNKKTKWRLIKWVMGTLLVMGLVAFFLVRSVIYLDPPAVEYALDIPEMRQEGDVRWIGNNWIRQRKEGLWEMYVEGEPYERGVIAGRLSQELIRYQEEVFVEQIREVIPSDAYLKFLRVLIGVFNRHLPKHIPLEYLQEIYGISKSASDEFNAIGPAYMRLLNYHAAHDIGHALQDYALVGCTSFSAWDSKTENGELLSGRNFDFYFGDDFARDKIVQFVNPSAGHSFAFITWGGMIGVVSGMNNKGLSITINAAQSSMPRASATPVSILAREILQYASTIDEAIAIASTRELFVSESFLITSSKDAYAAIIEKSPFAMDVVYPDTHFILCANHYQSDTFLDDPTNVKNRQENATTYRFHRLEELLHRHDVLSKENVAEILRDKKGLHDENIGVGNEKAINQMIAHHGVIFQPNQRKMFVSTSPNVLGAFVGYDIAAVFDSGLPPPKASLSQIPPDNFLSEQGYEEYRTFVRLRNVMQDAIKHKHTVDADTLTIFEQSNPYYFETYKWLGDYFSSRDDCAMALAYYRQALSKEINNQANRLAIKKSISVCNE